MATQVTLFVEDTDIKLLVTKDRQVDKWASLLLEPGLVSDGVILDEDQVAQKITELLQLQEVKERSVVAALPGLNSIFRVVSLPELPAAILPEAIRNEANRVIPMPLEQVYLSHQNLESAAGETKMFLVAFPRNSADALISTLGKAGLSIKTLDIAPLTLCRSVSAPRAIIVNSWLSNADIVIVADKVPQVVRSISLPTESVSLEEKLPSIAEELNRTVAFYNSSHTEAPLDNSVPLFVTGDIAREKASWPELVGRLNMKVAAMPSLLTAPETFDSSQYMVNIGLTLKALAPEAGEENTSVVNINALPEKYRPKGISLTSVLVPMIAVLAVGALVYGGFYVMDMRTETSELRNQVTAAESSVALQKAGISNLEVQISQTESQLEAPEATASILNDQIITMRFDREEVVGDIKTAVNLLPTTAKISQIEQSSDSLTIEGVATDENTIFNYGYSLRASGRFSEVVIINIVYNEGENGEPGSYTFVFLLK